MVVLWTRTQLEPRPLIKTAHFPLRHKKRVSNPWFETPLKHERSLPSHSVLILSGPSGTRTLDPLIKTARFPLRHKKKGFKPVV